MVYAVGSPIDSRKAPMAKPEPILNCSLPPAFRMMHLTLAREREHPAGDEKVGYVLVSPLTSEGKIDPGIWRDYKEACRVTRLSPDETDVNGHLVLRPGGHRTIRNETE